jgi:hypothetical protein
MSPPSETIVHNCSQSFTIVHNRTQSYSIVHNRHNPATNKQPTSNKQTINQQQTNNKQTTNNTSRSQKKLTLTNARRTSGTAATQRLQHFRKTSFQNQFFSDDLDFFLHCLIGRLHPVEDVEDVEDVEGVEDVEDVEDVERKRKEKGKETRNMSKSVTSTITSFQHRPTSSNIVQHRPT